MADFAEQKRVLEELVEVWDTVKKNNLIKFQKHTELVLNETFTPITEQLQKLVKSNTRRRKIKYNTGKDDFESIVELLNQSFTSSNDSENKNEELNLKEDDKDLEVPLFQRDRIYGPRFVYNKRTLGNSRLKLTDYDIVVGG